MRSRLRSITILSVVTLAMAFSTAAQDRRGETVIWKPIEVNGQKISTTNAFIEITSGQRRFSGNTGCNTMSGTVTMGVRNITIRPVIMTKRACRMMNGSVAEDTFITALKSSVRFTQRGSFMILYDRRSRAVLKLQGSEKEPGHDEPVVGATLGNRRWVLESIAGRPSAQITGAFVSFDSDKGSVGGDTGCNMFGGSYGPTKLGIRIREVISTMRACEEGDRMLVEREFLKGIRLTNRFQIKADRLQLYANSRLLLTLRGEAK